MTEKITEKRTVYVAYPNIEEHGPVVPIIVCAVEATARRLARKQDVHGSDGTMRAVKLVKIGGEWYAPWQCFTVVEPTHEDVIAQAVIDANRAKWRLRHRRLRETRGVPPARESFESE